MARPIDGASANGVKDAVKDLAQGEERDDNPGDFDQDGGGHGLGGVARASGRLIRTCAAVGELLGEPVQASGHSSAGERLAVSGGDD